MNTKQTRRDALRTLAAGGALVAVPLTAEAKPQVSNRALRIAQGFDTLRGEDQDTVERIVDRALLCREIEPA